MRILYKTLIVLFISTIICLSTDIKITWDDPNPTTMKVLKYRVYRINQDGSTNWVRIGETLNKFYNLTVTNGYYRFRITAVNAWGEGSYTTNSEAGRIIETPMPLNNVIITNWVR